MWKKIFFFRFFFLNIKVSLNLDSGHVRICPNLSEKSPTVNKDSRSGSDTRRGLRDLIQYRFWCLPSKYWEIYRCLSHPCCPYLLLVSFGQIRTNSDMSEFRVRHRCWKKKVEKNNKFQTSVLKFFTLVPKKDFSESASIVVKITIL